MAETLAVDLDAGFVLFFERYRRAVYSVALRLSGDRADAEDLTAEAFLRAYRALLRYEPQRRRELRAGPWLMTILLNQWRNMQRSRTRRPATQPHDHLPEVADELQVEALVEQEAGLRQLTAALGQLSEPQRMAIILRHVADFSVRDVARTMGLPEGTIKSHVSRGLAQLRRLTCDIEEQHDDHAR